MVPAYKLWESLHNLFYVLVSVRHLVLSTSPLLISPSLLCNPHLSFISPLLSFHNLYPYPHLTPFSPDILFYYEQMCNVTFKTAELTEYVLWSLVDILSRNPFWHRRDDTAFSRCNPDVKGLTGDHGCSVYERRLLTQLAFCFLFFFLLLLQDFWQVQRV